MQLLLFLYIGITMAVLMIWPEQYAGHRYFIGVIPLFIFLFLNGCLEIMNTITKKLSFGKYQHVIPAGGLIVFLVFFMFPHYAKALKPQQNFATYKQWNEKLPMPPSWNTSMLSTGVKRICPKKPASPAGNRNFFTSFQAAENRRLFPNMPKRTTYSNDSKNKKSLT